MVLLPDRQEMAGYAPVVVTIHHCKSALCALWLHFSALSRVGKRLSVFSKIDLFNGMHVW